jgi:hypothetical protein
MGSEWFGFSALPVGAHFGVFAGEVDGDEFGE